MPADQNYMLQDTTRYLLGFVCMSSILVVPGYLLGWLSNLFDFRQRRLVTRFLLGILLSTAVLPATFFLIGRFLSLDLVIVGIVLGLGVLPG